MVELRGSAKNNSTERNVINTITIFPEGLAFDYAVYAENQLSFSGGKNLNVYGSVFANDGIDFNGSATIHEDAYSPETIGNDGNIEGEIHEGVDPIPAPSLDTSVYEIDALGDGTYFASTSDAQTYINGNNILNKVIYIADDGDKASIGTSGTTVTGSIVKIGDMDLKGGTYTASENYAAIVVEGNLKISGGTTIYGIVYVTGATTFGGGNNTIHGSLISAGGASDTDTEIAGSAEIYFDPDVYANWQNLAGLNTESTEEPRIINWREE